MFLELGNLGTSEAVGSLSTSTELSPTELIPLGSYGLERQVIRPPAKQSCIPSIGKIKVFNTNLVIGLTTFLSTTLKLNSFISHSFKIDLGNQTNLMG